MSESSSRTDVPMEKSSSKKAFLSFCSKATQSLNDTVKSDENDEVQKVHVLQEYRKTASLLKLAMNSLPRSVAKKEKSEIQGNFDFMEACYSQTLLRMEVLKAEIANDSSKASESMYGSTRVLASGPEASTSKMQQGVLDLIVKTTNVYFKDVLGNDAAKRALREAVILPNLNQHDLFTGLREPVKGILLFGPPGNGKTMLAKACATEANCTFFNVSAAAIMSKWLGQAEKMMKALFDEARKRKPSMIFIDEADSLLSVRGEDDSGGGATRVKTEFLLQFDGITSHASDRVLVLLATNRPDMLDDAVLRRTPLRIPVDLPSKEARIDLVRRIMKDILNELDQADLEQIGIETVNYSYSDLTALCKEAAWAPIRALSHDEITTATKETVPPVKYEHFDEALKVVKPSTTRTTSSRMNAFMQNHAQGK